jgi:tRNA dimethylallyltransferase
MQCYNLISVLGPTAVGKTKLAANLAYKFNGEIISADSRQVYKGMDIGTGKDLNDYVVNDFSVPYYLIDIAEPTEEYNLFRFVNDFTKVFQNIIAREKIPFLVGGTGLYLDAIIRNYSLNESPADLDYREYLEKFTLEELQCKLMELNPRLHNTTDLINKERVIRAIEITVNWGDKIKKPQINSLVIGIKMDRKEIIERITNRLKQRLNSGMIDEIKLLVKNSINYNKLNFFGLEYRYVGLYLQGKLNFNDMFQKLNSAIHNFAKRQMTWFRKMEREGVVIHWIEGADIEKASQIIRENYFQ